MRLDSRNPSEEISSVVSPFQGNRLKTTSSPGRRSAAIAAPLCPGLICCSPFGAKKPTPSHPNPLRRRLPPRPHGHPGAVPRAASNLQHRTPLSSPPHADRARPSAAAKNPKFCTLAESSRSGGCRRGVPALSCPHVPGNRTRPAAPGGPGSPVFLPASPNCVHAVHPTETLIRGQKSWRTDRNIE